MNNNPIETALENAEGVFEIDLVNGISGTVFPKVPVRSDNTFRQIINEYGEDIEVAISEKKMRFTNKRTGQQTSDLDETVSYIGLENGDVLSVVDNCGVA